MKQQARLLNYLETNRVINPIEAWYYLGIYRLSAVIYDLKKNGVKIETTRIKVKNQFNEDCNVALYRLIEI